MPIEPNGSVVTVPALREALGLPKQRPEGVRDLLGVLWEPPEPVTVAAVAARPLALGDWPEAWRADPASGPQFLIALRDQADPYLIARVFWVDGTRWGDHTGADPQHRQVPVSARTTLAAVRLAGRRVLAGVSFGWPQPEEHFAFL